MSDLSLKKIELYKRNTIESASLATSAISTNSEIQLTVVPLDNYLFYPILLLLSRPV